MNTTVPTATHCLEVFFSDMQTHGVWPMLQQKEGKGLRHVSKHEATVYIRTIANALHAASIAPQDSVAFYGAPSIQLWLGEWGTLANRGVPVIIPRDFSLQSLIETLAETKSRLIFLDAPSTAHALLEASARLPHLSHIVCLQEEGEPTAPVLSWPQFLHMADGMPDRLPELLADIQPADKAILFYSQDKEGAISVVNYTHESLLAQAREMDAFMAHQLVIEQTAIQVKFRHKGNWRKATSYAHSVEADRLYIRNLDAVLAAVPWKGALGHLMGYYIPVFKGATVQIMDDREAMPVAQYSPHVIIGTAEFLDKLRQHITAQVEESGILRANIFMNMLKLGKQRYESAGTLNPLQRLQEIILKKMIVRRVEKLLGGRLRLVIGIEEHTRYETQLFFNSFGIGYGEFMPLASKSS